MSICIRTISSRLSFTLEPGSSHRTDIDVGVGEYDLMDCAVKRF